MLVSARLSARAQFQLSGGVYEKLRDRGNAPSIMSPGTRARYNWLTSEIKPIPTQRRHTRVNVRTQNK